MRLTLLPLLLLTGLAVAQGTPSQSPQNPHPTVVASGKALSQIKRIYVDSFGDDPISKEMQAMVVDSLTNSKVFAVTEDRDKADGILKGSTLEKTSQEAHSYSDATSVGVAHGSVHGSSSGDLSGSFVGGTGTINGSSTGSINGSTNSTHMADATSTSSVTTANDARASVRLVNGDGDVIWTTTQESKGAKYKGASADVANKIVRQLIWDVAKSAKTVAQDSSVGPVAVAPMPHAQPLTASPENQDAQYAETPQEAQERAARNRVVFSENGEGSLGEQAKRAKQRTECLKLAADNPSITCK